MLAKRRSGAELRVWRVGSGAPRPRGRFLAVVPGAEVPLLTLSLPPKLQGAARREVMERQIVDRLGQPESAIEIHAARLGDTVANWERAAVADRGRAEGWRAAVAAAKGRCIAILPDYLSLPAARGLWVLCAQEGAVSARLGTGDGFTAEPALAAHMLSHARQRGAPRAVLKLTPLGDEVEAVLAGLAQAERPEALPEGCTPARLAHGETSLDFATRPQAQPALAARRLRRVLLPFLLLALGGAAWAAATAMETARLRAEAAAFAAFAETAARQDFLGEAPLVDLRRQVVRELERLRAPSGGEGDDGHSALVRLRRIAEALAGAGAEPKSIDLAADTGVISVDLVAPSLTALEAIVSRARSRGFDLRVENARSDATGRARAELRFGEAAP